MPDSAQIEQLKAAIEAQTEAIRLQIVEESRRTTLEREKLEIQGRVANAEVQRNNLLSAIGTSIALLNESHSIVIDMLYEDVVPSMIDDYRIMTTLIDSIRQLFILIAELTDDKKYQPEINKQVQILDDILSNERKKTMEKELLAHIRRLDVLKERRALQGTSVEASIITEIHEIERSVEELKGNLNIQ